MRTVIAALGLVLMAVLAVENVDTRPVRPDVNRVPVSVPGIVLPITVPAGAEFLLLVR